MMTTADNAGCCRRIQNDLKESIAKLYPFLVPGVRPYQVSCFTIVKPGMENRCKVGGSLNSMGSIMKEQNSLACHHQI